MFIDLGLFSEFFFKLNIRLLLADQGICIVLYMIKGLLECECRWESKFSFLQVKARWEFALK